MQPKLCHNLLIESVRDALSIVDCDAHRCMFLDYEYSDCVLSLNQFNPACRGLSHGPDDVMLLLRLFVDDVMSHDCLCQATEARG